MKEADSTEDGLVALTRAREARGRDGESRVPLTAEPLVNPHQAVDAAKQ